MNSLPYLTNKAREIRLECLNMQHAAQKGHLGGAFSAVELLVGLYYSGIVTISPKIAKDPQRDRIILSKGHACLSLFAVLADTGFFPKTELENYGQNGRLLGGHPDHLVPGVEVSSGSLGHGLGIGAGMALAAKLDKQHYITYVIVGDGECNEGSVWEAVTFAAAQNLNNLIAIVDNNKVGATTKTQKFLGTAHMEDKWSSFGWDTVSIQGNDISAVLQALQKTRHRTSNKKPLAIIAHTIKGKGVSFMEDDPQWHHGVASNEQFKHALEELQQ
jgi:transketolase